VVGGFVGVAVVAVAARTFVDDLEGDCVGPAVVVVLDWSKLKKVGGFVGRFGVATVGTTGEGDVGPGEGGGDGDGVGPGVGGGDGGGVGPGVGGWVGFLVGLLVGGLVGGLVGFFVGFLVGFLDGAGDGIGDGEGVAKQSLRICSRLMGRSNGPPVLAIESINACWLGPQALL